MTHLYEMAEEIARKREIAVEDALALAGAAKGFWDALGQLGFVDSYGGMEFCRIFPETIEAIHKLANPIAHMTAEQIAEMR